MSAYVYDSDEWWPNGLPEWIAEQVAAEDELFVALDKGLRSFGWPAYNVPRPLPLEDSWPGLALALAQRLREAREVIEEIRSVPSQRTLLLNAEARAMYELASRSLARP